MTVDVEVGDVVVFTHMKSFPVKQEQAAMGVVEEVEADRVRVEMDGWVDKEDIVENKGKSPSHVQ